jgi:hypothetical protein
VRRTAPGEVFEGRPHERITWQHLLQQTSEWSGTLWGVPWWADPQGGQHRDGPLGAPGTTWAYNDVRVNVLALALLHVFGEPLQTVLEDKVMRVIDASATIQWHGYRNSYVEIDGKRLPSVSGGAHWGGGVWASAYDHARIGLLYLRGDGGATRRSSLRDGLSKAGRRAQSRPTTATCGGVTTSTPSSRRRRRPAAARGGTAAGSSSGSIQPVTSSSYHDGPKISAHSFVTCPQLSARTSVAAPGACGIAAHRKHRGRPLRPGPRCLTRACRPEPRRRSAPTTAGSVRHPQRSDRSTSRRRGLNTRRPRMRRAASERPRPTY